MDCAAVLETKIRSPTPTGSLQYSVRNRPVPSTFNTDSDPQVPDSSPLPPWFWYGVAIIGLATMGAIGWAIWRMVRDTQRALVRTGQAAADFAGQIRSALQESFGVTPRIDGRPHPEGSVPTLELVVLRRTVTRTVQWTSTRLGSTKRISATATFTIRAGLDLQTPIQVDVDSASKAATAHFPAPKVLAVQVDAVQPAAEESGWWNRIRPEDRIQVQAELQESALRDVLQAGLLEEAQVEIRSLLQRTLSSKPSAGQLTCLFEPRDSPQPQSTTGPAIQPSRGGA